VNATPTPAKPAEAPKTAAAPPKDAASAKTPEPAKTAEPAKAGAPAVAEPARSTPADAKAGSYSVQLAAFIDDKGANALAGRLKKSGYPAYTEPYNTSRGTLWRVRVGPFPSRDAAEAARAKLKGDGQNGIITAAAK
jgi:DedD protein